MSASAPGPAREMPMLRNFTAVVFSLVWLQSSAAVVEYQAPEIDHYFITANAAELIDRQPEHF